ncbi:MAG: hypothetical protein J0H09_21850 [Burkholderiales bacterium]|nr:hypothetical protein [Burkholderiales bacterium]
MIHRRLMARRALLCLGLASALPSARAQSHGKILCGFPAGSGTLDLLSRVLAEELGKETGRTFVVENKTGAGGTLAVKALMTSPPDGSTLLFAPGTTLTIYPHTVADAGYDPLKDLVPIACIGEYTMGIAVKNDQQVRDLGALVSGIKQDPRRAVYGSPGAGSLPHFFGMKIGEAVGVQFTHVPYRGSGPAVMDVVGGVLASVVAPVGAILQHKQSGALKILASSGERRGARTADIPTFAELGYPNLTSTGWFGAFAPPGTPDAECERLNQTIARIFQRPEVQTRLAAADVDPKPMTRAALRELVATEYRGWKKIVQDSGFRADK